MKIAACHHVLREQSTTALLATCQFAICAQSSKGVNKQAVQQAGKRVVVVVAVVVRKPADRNDRFYYILVTAG